MFKRLRRNRKSASIRTMLQETHIYPQDIVHPLFLIEGENKIEPIETLPSINRYSIDNALIEAKAMLEIGVKAVLLFPIIPKENRSDMAEEAYNENGLISRAIKAFKEQLPSLTIMTDVALDPYTTHCHDGITVGEEIDNDKTLEVLTKQALCYAKAGCDVVAPSDMMDGRVKVIRAALEEASYTQVSILSYTAKFASSFYGPFRHAIKTKLAFGDKKTYQLNPANIREALLEAKTDEEEGADMLMVKPAVLYLDVIAKLKQQTALPIGAYHVSGEFAMLMAAHDKGILDAKKALEESLLSIKRAGADFIVTYGACLLFDVLPLHHESRV